MKVIRIIFLVFFLVFANVFIAHADPPPGPPTNPNPGDDLPIDQNIVFLMMAGLALGTVFIYRNKTKKASM
ncbi:hypothetical protein [uncultured Flavobacterium sp.]|uniref:hypothetical protein n=1 Tax=uncultured Flavobacterium sp. TaxID=165435 RepID=UPI002930AEBA|nr:hypothetical protein [uncultured Flavobacterium sp.]